MKKKLFAAALSAALLLSTAGRACDMDKHKDDKASVEKEKPKKSTAKLTKKKATVAEKEEKNSSKI
jgi:hypothetical protein